MIRAIRFGCCFALLVGMAHSASGKTSGGGMARVVIEEPKQVFGGKKALVTVDTREKKARLRKGTLSLSIEPGSYGIYKSGSALRRATIGLEANKTFVVTITTPTKPQPAGDTSSYFARLVVVEPQAVVKAEKIDITFGKRTRSKKLGEDSLGIMVQPGTYTLKSESATKAATLELAPKGVYYFLNRKDPWSHKLCGDKLYHEGNYSGALAHYRAGLELDTSITDMYRRYAELAVLGGTTKEIEIALGRVIRAGLADGKTYRMLGDMHLKKKRYKSAVDMYEKAVKENEKDASALAGLGKARLNAGEPDGAVSACMRAVDLQPDTASHYRTLGDAYFALGDTLKGMSAHRRFLDKGGKSSVVAQGVGTYAYNRRRFEDAAKYLGMVQGKRSQMFDHVRMVGESHYRIGQYKKAFTLLRLAANKYPREELWPDVVEMLIKTYIELKEHKKAEYWVNKYAERSRKKSPDVAYYRAYLQERSSAAKAKALYEQNIQHYPSDHRNYLRLGLIESKSRKTLSTAVVHLKKAVALADTIPEAWLEIADVYRQLDRADDELSALRVFVASEPQHPDANARIGELMLRKGKTGEALKQLEKATEAGSDDPRVLLALAQGYSRSGRPQDAIKVLEDARDVAPGNVEVRKRLANLYHGKGEAVKALEELKKVIELRRDNETLLFYAQVLYEQQQYDAGADAIEDIRATDPENIEALMLLGTILRAHKRPLEAVEVYREVAMIDPLSSIALSARADAHLEANQINWAETFYKRALRMDDRNALAIFGLAKVAKVRGDTAGYKKYLSRARKIDPRHPAIKKEYEANK